MILGLLRTECSRNPTVHSQSAHVSYETWLPAHVPGGSNTRIPSCRPACTGLRLLDPDIISIQEKWGGVKVYGENGC